MAFYCHDCSRDTKTSGPVLIRRLDEYKYHLTSVCVDCHSTKRGFLPPSIVAKFPVELRKMREQWSYLDYIDTASGKVKVFPLIDHLIN